MPRIYYLAFGIFLLFAAGLRVLLDKPITLPKNQPIKFEATIKRDPRVYDTHQVIYAADSRIYVSPYPRYRVGDRLLVEGMFDSEGKMFDPSVNKIGEVSSIASFRSDLREKISGRIGELLPAREATLVVGTVLGIDTIGADFREELIKTGTIHVVVVSGQNLMIICGMIFALSKFIGRRKSMIFSAVAVFSYAFLTGFEPPVVRASIMVLASTAALFLGRESSVIWSLAIAAVGIILVWPQALFEISFQLTFAATLGIVTLGRLMTSFAGSSTGATRRYKFIRLFFEIAAIPLSAFVFTAPLIMFYFSRVSLISPVVNILVSEAVMPIMVFGFLIAFATLIFMPLAQVLAYFAYVPALYFSEVVRLFSNIPIL